MIYDLFSVPVYSAPVDIVTEDELLFAMEQDMYANEGNKISKNFNVLFDRRMERIHINIQKALKYYMREIIRPRCIMDLYVTESWFNYISPGGYHHRHYHQNSFVSGVFYMQAKDSAITFHMPMDLYGLSPDSDSKYLGEMHHVPANTGSTLIFPSRLQHEVQMARGDSERISVAFNTFLRGDVSVTKSVGLRL